MPLVEDRPPMDDRQPITASLPHDMMWVEKMMHFPIWRSSAIAVS